MCSLNIVYFPYNVLIFLNSASSAAAQVFYLPGVCVHTLTPRENRFGNFLKIFEKNTIFNEHPVHSGPKHLHVCDQYVHKKRFIHFFPGNSVELYNYNLIREIDKVR